MNKTIKAFKDDISNSLKLREKILLNIELKTKEEMVLNQVQLNFNFEEEKVELTYYILDSNYPDVIIDFNRLKDILNAVRYH